MKNIILFYLGTIGGDTVRSLEAIDSDSLTTRGCNY